MNHIPLVLTFVITINAIRVPTAWPDRNAEFKNLKTVGHGGYFKRISVNNKEDYRIYPPTRLHIQKKPHKVSKLPYHIKHFNSKPKKYYKKYKPADSAWTPIVPSTYKSQLHPTKLNKHLRQYPRTRYIQASSEYVTSRSSPLYKNYRDDRTYEQEESNNERITESLPDIERPSLIESEHEHPADIPTAPIYPGEGQWAKPGKKHKPFVSKQKYSQLPNDQDEELDGYEIFLRGKSLYDKKQAQFDGSGNEKSQNNENIKDKSEQQKKEEEEESEEEDFVPSTMYVQVRKSENEEHLPKDAEGSEDGRLKEVIKDSKILTVYTEEGYEDSAYDHAGHEKEAEDSQGYKEYKKEEEGEKHPSQKQRGYEDQTEDGSTKIYKTVNNPNKSKDRLKPMRSNKLYKTESTKTVMLKDEPDGRKMKTISEIKTNTNPKDNKVAIFPFVAETSANNQQNQIKSENTSTDSHQALKSRKKRFANDFPKIDVKTDFINSVIREDHKKYNMEREEIKYPYYNSQNINPNSALRYSENMDNIPEKTGGRMAFYEKANKIECPEVEEDIAVIPERIEDVEKSVNEGSKLEDSEEAGKSPRLGKLGQRIDCFKRKYFGENPLDSPFFKEKEIEPVTPMFKVLQERSAGFQANHVKSNEPTAENFKKKKYHSKFSSRIKASPSNYKRNNVEEVTSDEILNDVRIHDGIPKGNRANLDSSYDNMESSPEVEVINVDTFKSINGFTSEKPPVSLITTPKYSVNITPKHIYDQIKLLDFLPSPTLSNSVANNESSRKGKTVEDVTEASQLRMRPHFQNFTPRRPQRTRKRKPQFDVDSFIQDTSRRVTLTPNSYRTEDNGMHNEQTPLDQMNVFADVINNIRNGSNDPLKLEATSYITQNHYQSNAIRMRVPPKRIHIKVPESVKYSNERKSYFRTTTIPTTISTSTTKSKRGSIRFVTTEKEVNYDDYLDAEEEPENDKKNIVLKSVTMVPPENIAIVEENVDSEVSASHTTETIYKDPVRKAVEIIGLVPPSRYHYRTIHQPVEDPLTEPIVSESEIINNYHVLGMKPPSTQQKVYDYSEFHRIFNSKKPNNHKYLNHRRGKRSPNRKSYFEVVRGQNSQDDQAEKQEEDDDYIPHRPKNWHWDEKLKKIVYDKPKVDEDSDDDEEEDEEFIEVVNSTPRNIQQTTTRRSFPITTPLNGPSYVDFVQLLRSKKDYISIPDPTTTKDGIEMETTSSTTTVRANPTEPPEFLSFVSKLRQSDSYKLIEEKNKTKTSTTKTTELPESEEEDIEDTDSALSNIQNSPGRGAVDIGQNLKIFDVNDFLPKIKTYSPRTEIDYSKYKTIQRPRVQSTTESSEKENDEDLTSKKEFKIEVQSSESSTEGKLEIFELSRPTTTPTSTTTTTTSTTTTEALTTVQKIRRRRPTTTQRSTSLPSTISKNEAVTGTYSKPKRVYPRRRPTHIRTRTTTPRTKDDATPQESRKIVSRRHNSVERSPKLVSLESIIQMNSQKAEGDTSKGSTSEKVENNVDDVLKNINRLKEVSVEETVSDYSLGLEGDEETESKDDYYDEENKKISLDSGTTNKKLVISKDKQKGMFYYTSVR